MLTFQVPINLLNKLIFNTIYKVKAIAEEGKLEKQLFHLSLTQHER